ncbi:hypothetical protein [Aeromonas hydrophila]|uniref:hypothetical protein n=1 Tax=Aeromonas hydrophila TaxID=644 RepID=UPI002B4A4A2B|nr:hypothetical protein [Aeromonas hydrophila]
MKNINNLAAVNGVIKEKEYGFEYVPTLIDEQNLDLGYQYCSVKSDHYFSGGEILFKIKLNSKETKIQLILNWGINPLYICFNDDYFSYSLKTFQPQTNQLVPLSQTGSKSNIKENTEYEVRVLCRANQTKYYVNNVEMLSWNYQVTRSPIAFNVFGTGSAEIYDISVLDDKPKAFVVMQFTEKFNELYDNVIKPVCEQKGLEPIRADDMYSNGLIIHDIIQSIQQSSLIISDITPDNPNVYYEVGYAHAAGKNVILMCDREREKLPFDLSGFRTIFYSNTIAGKSKVEETLKKHLDNIY